MEIKQLQGFVLLIVLVGMILGVGILTLDKFGEAVKNDVTVINETIAVSSLTATTANNDVTAINSIYNQTLEVVVMTTGTGENNFTFSTGGTLLFNGSIPNGDYLITYVYDADSAATTGLTNTASAMAPIATTWLPLIVTVGALAIVLGLVIASFSASNRRR